VRVRIITLGCPKNQVDSEKMAGALLARGHRLVGEHERCDVIVVNTCGFIQAAKEESLDTILEAARERQRDPGVKLLVAGCLSQRYGGELAQELPEVDGIIGVEQLDRLDQVLAALEQGERPVWTERRDEGLGGELPRWVSADKGYAYLKIAEGCDNRCAYCAIPLIRGPFRSRPLPELLQEAAALARSGVRELILVAQDPTRWGGDLPGEANLLTLLRALLERDWFHWIRLQYIYPARLDRELLALLTEQNALLPYVDVPVQHSHPEILRAMGRPPLDPALLDALLALREARPDAGLRTTLLVGFPGETEEHAAHLLEFVERMRFDHLGVFEYSPEEETPAFSLPPVPPETARRRRERIMELQALISAQLLAARAGQRLPVLLDGAAVEVPGALAGHAPFQSPDADGQVILEDPGEHRPGELIEVEIVGATTYDLVGRALE
jgi:ribosomal protein S12 methylthiotransferase